MVKFLKSILRKIIPPSILNYYSRRKYNKFTRIKDCIGNKTFKMFLREDSLIEIILFKNGLYGEWEKESLKLWAEISKNAHTIIDVGANTGIYSLLAYNNNSNAKIIAIEPVELNYNILIQNIKKNMFPISTEMIALSDKEGAAKMFMLKDQLNYMTCINNNRYEQHPEMIRNREVIELEVITKSFSYIFEKYNLGNLDLIKIDVEGHESAVINGMLPYLERYKPIILIEIIGENNAEILDKIFKSIGYEYISIDEINKPSIVDKLWDNNHHNFLICNKNVIEYLKSKNLVN